MEESVTLLQYNIFGSSSNQLIDDNKGSRIRGVVGKGAVGALLQQGQVMCFSSRGCFFDIRPLASRVVDITLKRDTLPDYKLQLWTRKRN